MNKILLLCVLFLPSCGLYADLQKTVADAKEVVAETKAIYSEAKVAADADKDGKTTIPEWMAWAAGGGLVGVIAALKALFTKSTSLQAQANELYDAHNENKVAIAANTAKP